MFTPSPRSCPHSAGRRAIQCHFSELTPWPQHTATDDVSSLYPRCCCPTAAMATSWRLVSSCRPARRSTITCHLRPTDGFQGYPHLSLAPLCSLKASAPLKRRASLDAAASETAFLPRGVGHQWLLSVNSVLFVVAKRHGSRVLIRRRTDLWNRICF